MTAWETEERQERQGREFLASSVPAEVTLAPGAPSPEEQRLREVYRKKGLTTLVDMLRRFQRD